MRRISDSPSTFLPAQRSGFKGNLWYHCALLPRTAMKPLERPSSCHWPMVNCCSHVPSPMSLFFLVLFRGSGRLCLAFFGLRLDVTSPHSFQEEPQDV